MILPTSKIYNSSSLALENGGELGELAVAYETWGNLNDAGDNAVLVCHGYTNNPHAAGDDKGWFHGLIGPGKAVDTGRYFVIAANLLGSSYGSTGPASINPETGHPYGLDFPDITVGDMVNAENRLLEHLGVKQLAAVMGNSLGGHLAFDRAARFPDQMRAVVVTVSSLQGRGNQDSIDALIARFSQCPGWNDGQYYDNKKDGGVFSELLKQRIETLKNYGFDTKIREEVGDNPDIIEQRLVALAEPWADQFDANSLIVLRKAVIQFDIRKKVAVVKAPILYVLSRTDNLFPPSIAPDTMKILTDAGVNAKFFELDSDNGHRAPSVDWQGWTDELQKFMEVNAAL
jgi:homoserine O-acetyltransferase/O-succinyltransferase